MKIVLCFMILAAPIVAQYEIAVQYEAKPLRNSENPSGVWNLLPTISDKFMKIVSGIAKIIPDNRENYRSAEDVANVKRQNKKIPLHHHVNHYRQKRLLANNGIRDSRVEFLLRK